MKLARGEGVGEALCCFCAEGLALCRGCRGLLWLLSVLLVIFARLERVFTMMKSFEGKLE